MRSPSFLIDKPNSDTLFIETIEQEKYESWLAKRPHDEREWFATVGFKARRGEFNFVPASGETKARVVLGLGDAPEEIWTYGDLAKRLPQGSYQFLKKSKHAEAATLGWALGAYSFQKYKPAEHQVAQLVWPDNCDRDSVLQLMEATYLARDLITTPANDMGPEELANVTKSIARTHKAKCTVITGDALLEKNYPTIHAVGRASSREPRLIDLKWGALKNPQVTLVGKGVVFDTGGLDLKPAGGMILMKKDMGGAAMVLAVAHAIMLAKLPIRLRVLIPAVENAVSGNAFRPLDVIKTRDGTLVEVGNTDAEGRLVLCDALAEAISTNPDLIIDCATLTGAARVALGTSLPALFSNRDSVANDILKAGEKSQDPLWRLPLHAPYRSMLNSQVADMNNVSSGGYAGAITAALFLQEFVGDIPWVHVDAMAYNLDSSPGRPKGGEAMGVRALIQMLKKRFPASKKKSQKKR
jgi:leucyl aminopeptidase